MDKKTYIGNWLYCNILFYKDQFQEIDNLEMVHADYRTFVKENLTNTIYYCERIEDEYLVLNSKKIKLKVKANAIKKVLPKSTFIWNDKVSLIEKPNCEAIIDDLFWHSKDEEYKYYLIVDGKKKSKYYSHKDLKFLND